MGFGRIDFRTVLIVVVLFTLGIAKLFKLELSTSLTILTILTFISFILYPVYLMKHKSYWEKNLKETPKRKEITKKLKIFRVVLYVSLTVGFVLIFLFI